MWQRYEKLFNNPQSSKFQHEHLHPTGIEIDGCFLVRARSLDAEDGAWTEFGVHDAHTFLQKVRIGRLEVLWDSGLTCLCRSCCWRVLYFAETVLAEAAKRLAAHRRSPSERGLLRLLDEAGVDFIDES